MGVKFSQLPETKIDNVSPTCQIAVLNGDMVYRMKLKHDSEYRSVIGGASEDRYGHVIVSDEFDVPGGGAITSTAASHLAVYSLYSFLQKCWRGTRSQWNSLSDEDKERYVIIVLTDE